MSIATALKQFLQRFTVLFGAPRELWLSFLGKFLVFVAYPVTNYTLKLWLSSEYNYSDQKALGIVTAWSLTMTICTVLVGSLTDALGIRRTFFLGVWVCILGRAVMVFTRIKWLVLAGGLFPLAVGEALSAPVLVAAIRRYSNSRQRSISFSLFYMMMNFGFLAAGCLFDWVRHGLGEHGHLTVPFLGLQITTYRTLFLISLAVECLLLPVVYFLRPGAEATEEGLKLVPEPVRYPGQGLGRSFLFTVRDSLKETRQLFAGLMRQSGFYRLLGFLLLVAFVKMIFMLLQYVFPTFGIRELGEGASVGGLTNINSILVLVLLPIVGATTQRFSAYRMVTFGCVLAAASVFILALPTQWFEPLANAPLTRSLAHWYLGLKGTVHPYYVMSALFITLLSVGEVFYSPRVYEYAASIAPKGQEASYGALSYIPFLLAKMLVGTWVAALLADYCPETGVRHSYMMWLLVALTASVAPVGLIALRKFIRVRELGREE